MLDLTLLQVHSVHRDDAAEPQWEWVGWLLSVLPDQALCRPIKHADLVTAGL